MKMTGCGGNEYNDDAVVRNDDDDDITDCTVPCSFQREWTALPSNLNTPGTTHAVLQSVGKTKPTKHYNKHFLKALLVTQRRNIRV